MLKRDLPPQQAQEAMGGIRGMVKQQNSWKAIRESEQSAASPEAAAPPKLAGKLDAKRPVAGRADLQGLKPLEPLE